MSIVLIKRYFELFMTCVSIIFLFSKCKEEYDPHIEAKTTGLLVVEGFINSGQGSTTFHLSRSSDLEDATFKPEPGALLNVEGEDGSSFPLFNNGNGEYIVPQLTLYNGVRYRLHIRTNDGREYVSDYSSVKYTPAIDSITWQRENDGLRLYANAHDPLNDTKYYQWKYEETWEIHSAYYNELEYLTDPVTSRPWTVKYKYVDQHTDTTIYKCWNTLASSSIILGSTEKLTSDLVYLPVQYIEPRSEKLSVLYSINLRQYAISQEEYLFLQKMKKNTEQLGTIFDPQPSEISGNIHCLTDPNETVIGHVEITDEQVKRVFISNSQVPDWNYDPGCVFIEIDNQPDSIARYGVGLMPTLVSKKDPFRGILAFYASTPPCVDCTLRGVHQRPDFWP
ncbi:MAG TPA: DUF4249 domain-containing protein [Chitinophagaceae bacterium]|jgi:uncharacterized protein DUF4249|nr:DUF4249 domain-containing protein [Chitinophagaceae bacterium]